MINGRTRVFALLGQPVAHSLSPAMHNAAFHVLGLPAVYVALSCRPDDVASLMHALGAAGGGGNVTVPHKEIAAAAVNGASRLVEQLRACNTFWGDDGAVRGDNTDVDGIAATIDRLAPPPGTWLVLGTGGSARAAAAAAVRYDAPVAVRSREPARAAAFLAWAEQALGARRGEPETATVVINATPSGLSPTDPLPLEPAEIPRGAVVLDLVYGRGETPWVRRCRVAGHRAADGRGVLVAQGAAAFVCWFPHTPPPVEVMRAAVDAALR